MLSWTHGQISIRRWKHVWTHAEVAARSVEVVGLSADDGFVDLEAIRPAGDGEVGVLLGFEEPVMAVCQLGG